MFDNGDSKKHINLNLSQPDPEIELPRMLPAGVNSSFELGSQHVEEGNLGLVPQVAEAGYQPQAPMIDYVEAKEEIVTQVSQPDPTADLPEMHPPAIYAHYEAGQQQVAKRIFGSIPQVPAGAQNQFRFSIHIPHGDLECVATLNKEVIGVMMEDQRAVCARSFTNPPEKIIKHF